MLTLRNQAVTLALPQGLGVAMAAQKSKSMHEKTREVTLHRIIGHEPKANASWNIRNVVDMAALKPYNFQMHEVSIKGLEGIFVEGASKLRPIEWADDALVTTGVNLSKYKSRSIGALLLFEVDEDWMAVGYGNGHHWLNDDFRDPRFGLDIAIRCLNPGEILGLTRRYPGARGRTDSVVVPGGLPIGRLISASATEIARRLNGRVRVSGLTFCEGKERDVKLEGAAGLRTRLAVKPHQLISDVRSLLRLRSGNVIEELDWVQYIRPVESKSILSDLRAELSTLLSSKDVDSEHLTLAIPEDLLHEYSANTLYKLGRMPHPQDMITLGDILNETAKKKPTPEKWIHNARVGLYRPDEENPFKKSKVLRWLEATVSTSSGRFILLDGHWYEVDRDYAARLQSDVRRILSRPASLTLPHWQEAEEKDYNEKVGQLDGFVCMDRKLVRSDFFNRYGFEACDLLGPNNELIHVKPANRASTLSHLFAQGMLAAQTLAADDRARRLFANLVHKQDPKRYIPNDFKPSRLIFAIMLKGKNAVDAKTLFAFSQATLVTADNVLRNSLNTTVEVAPILDRTSA